METTSNGPDIRCPSCGETHRDIWEYGGPFEIENAAADVDCDCGARLRLTCRVMVTYTLTKKE